MCWPLGWNTIKIVGNGNERQIFGLSSKIFYNHIACAVQILLCNRRYKATHVCIWSHSKVFESRAVSILFILIWWVCVCSMDICFNVSSSFVSITGINSEMCQNYCFPDALLPCEVSLLLHPKGRLWDHWNRNGFGLGAVSLTDRPRMRFVQPVACFNGHTQFGLLHCPSTVVSSKCPMWMSRALHSVNFTHKQSTNAFAMRALRMHCN